MTTHRIKADATRPETGFSIIAILVLVAAIAAVVTTFSRHVMVYAKSSAVSAAALEADEVIDSQIDFVLRSQQVGSTISSTTMKDAVVAGVVGHGKVTQDKTNVQIADMKTTDSTVMNRSSLLATIISPNGIGATRLVETGRVPAIAASDSTSLPKVQDAIVAALTIDASVPKITYTTDTLVKDTDLYGLLIVFPSVTLTLDNVVIQGAVVSSATTGATALESFNPATAPRVDIQGPVRIISQPFLENLAVSLPDGVLQSSNVDARLQIQGDVIAHTLQLDCGGAITGGIASVVAPTLGAGMFQVGVGRGPRTWSPTLDHHDIWDPEFVAFVPRNLTVTDLSTITSYQVP